MNCQDNKFILLLRHHLGEEGRELSEVSLERALISFMRATPSGPNHLLQTLPPVLSHWDKVSTWGIWRCRHSACNMMVHGKIVCEALSSGPEIGDTSGKLQSYSPLPPQWDSRDRNNLSCYLMPIHYPSLDSSFLIPFSLPKFCSWQSQHSVGF